MRMRKPQPATLQGQAVRLRPVTADDAPRLTEILTHRSPAGGAATTGTGSSASWSTPTTARSPSRSRPTGR
jgi:hypothetical protein